MQGVRHSKPDEVTKEIKSQLKEQVHSSDSSLAETIVAAGKQKLAKKPEDKQSALTGIFILLHTFSWLYARLHADSAAVFELKVYTYCRCVTEACLLSPTCCTVFVAFVMQLFHCTSDCMALEGEPVIGYAGIAK